MQSPTTEKEKLRLLKKLKDTWGKEAVDDFRHTSIAFLRAVWFMSQTHDWNIAKDALSTAREERQKNPVRGTSKDKVWTVLDVKNARHTLQQQHDGQMTPSAVSSSHESPRIASDTATDLITLSDGDDADCASAPRPLFQIRPNDLDSLTPGKWLNDQIIAGVSEVVEGALGTEAIAIIDSLSIPRPEGSIPRLQRAKVSKLIALPIKLIDHWVIAFINESREDIDIYDSMPSVDYFIKAQTEIRRVYHILTDKDFVGEFHYTMPHYQQNGFDCGIHALTTLLYKAVGAPMPTWIDAACCRRTIQAMVGPLPEKPPADFEASFNISNKLVIAGEVPLDKLPILLQQLLSEVAGQYKQIKSNASGWASSLIPVVQKLRHAAETRGSQVAPEVLSRLQSAEEYLQRDMTNHTKIKSSEEYLKRLQILAGGGRDRTSDGSRV